MMNKIYNHISPGLSKLESKMEPHIPPGGNWKNIPNNIKSKRLDRIRDNGGRTTYYGRLEWEKPAYTITTYFHRLPNSSNLHPEQNRMISIREAARLQSFPDDFVFWGSKGAIYKQIGNAVPPLMARAIADQIAKHLDNEKFIDLFAGAGGMSIGFELADYKLNAALELNEKIFETNIKNHSESAKFVTGDITDMAVKKELLNVIDEEIGVVVGGPPCQGFSYAGWRNPNDRRNILFKEFHNLVKEVQPEFFVMENVPGILTMRNGEVINEINDYFKKIGYHVYTPFKLSAENYGVPQKRKRVFIVGSKKKVDFSIPNKLFDDNDLMLPPPVTVSESIKSLPELGLKDGENEIEYEFDDPTLYDLLMQKEITFQEFYKYKKKLKISA